jgi:hypothetical protein
VLNARHDEYSHAYPDEAARRAEPGREDTALTARGRTLRRGTHS